MTGRLYGIGVGPGDPELLTLKAHRLITTCPAVAYFAAVGRESNARRIVADPLASRHDCRELRLEYPVTTETLPDSVSYETLLVDFYDESAKRLAETLDAGLDVALLCEGDPLFFGSYMYMHNRLATRYETVVVPGVPSMVASAAVLGAPLVCRDEVLCVISGVLPGDEIERRLVGTGAAVIMKLGRNLAKVRDAVTRAGLLEHAHYVERATMDAQRVMPLADADASTAPYFSMVVIPSRTAPDR
jgi:precorrin-2/cobalt-factor-2 C20-methyltransferase